MDDVGRDLLAYYEEEARLGIRTDPSERRIALLEDFVALAVGEGRRSVVEFGAGPGLDGVRFGAAGLAYAGINLAHGNAVLAAARGTCVVQADLTAPPFPPRSFDAAWSMSTLMHVPATDTARALAAMTAVLRPGAPFLVGLWGADHGHHGDLVSERGVAGQRRLFSVRPFAANAALIGEAASIEWSTRWDFGPDEWSYHVFRLRARDHGSAA